MAPRYLLKSIKSGRPGLKIQQSRFIRRSFRSVLRRGYEILANMRGLCEKMSPSLATTWWADAAVLCTVVFLICGSYAQGMHFIACWWINLWFKDICLEKSVFRSPILLSTKNQNMGKYYSQVEDLCLGWNTMLKTFIKRILENKIK